MSRPWFRAYAEFVSDAKVQLLAFDDQRHFHCLCCLKCNGTLDSRTPSPEFRDRMIAKALGLDLTSALEARRRLAEVGLIGTDWQPTRWDERQYEHDVSTDRVRRFRERQADVKRSRNVSETGEIRSEQNRTETRTRASAPSEGAPRAPILAPGEARQVLDRILEGKGHAAGE